MDKWPGQAHHVQRLQGVLALTYQDQNRWRLYRLWCWPADAGRPVYFALYPKRGMFWDTPYPRIHCQFQRVLPKNVFHLVSGVANGLAAINAPTVPPASNVRRRPQSPLVIPHRAPNPAPALPISKLVSADKYALRPNSV